jgi:hypothetical protein
MRIPLCISELEGSNTLLYGGHYKSQGAKHPNGWPPPLFIEEGLQLAFWGLLKLLTQIVYPYEPR